MGNFKAKGMELEKIPWERAKELQIQKIRITLILSPYEIIHIERITFGNKKLYPT